MIIGAILQAASISYAMLVVARIVTGLGNGLNVSNLRKDESYPNLLPRLLRCLHIMPNARQLKNEEPTVECK